MTWHDELDVRATALDPRLMDDAMYAYEDWLEESRRVQHAYAQWSRARRADGRACFAAYLSALDAEQRAAEDFCDAAARLRRAAIRRSSPSSRPRRS